MTDSREAIFREAQRLQGQNQVAEAISAYQRALLQWPEHANSWFNLGLLFRRARLPDEALVCYQKALNLGIANPEEVHLNRGVVYADDLRQDAEAERELGAALASNPNYLPALLNLANIHEDRGERDAALELYQRALQLDPQCTLALARSANMRKPADCDPELIAQLRSALARPAMAEAERALLGFALGRVLDASGGYEQAFEAYATANATMRAGAARARQRYDRRAQEQFVDRLIRAGGSARYRCPSLSAACFVPARRWPSSCWPGIRAWRRAASWTCCPRWSRANSPRFQNRWPRSPGLISSSWRSATWTRWRSCFRALPT